MKAQGPDQTRHVTDVNMAEEAEDRLSNWYVASVAVLALYVPLKTITVV